MGGGRISVSSSSSSSPEGSDEVESSTESSDETLRRCKTYLELLHSYENPPQRSQTLQEAKDAIIRHMPGDWMEEVGGLEKSDCEFPGITTLILIGPRGSGKSSLVNRITRVFDEDKFAPDRAQVSYNVSVTNGSCFLQEYMVPRNSKSLCLYDTRSLSSCRYDNFIMLSSLMIQGVRHGKMMTRASENVSVKRKIQIMAREFLDMHHIQKRTVDFVIFVVDGASILKAMGSNDAAYNDMLVADFNCPYLTFRDNKPAVVVTHGDELSFNERARVSTHLGELLGIPPTKQIFDIPDASDCDTEMAIVDMLRYSIEHADRNLSFTRKGQRNLWRKMQKLWFYKSVIMLEVLVVCLCWAWVLFKINKKLMK